MRAFWLRPDPRFFDLFEQAAANAVRSADLFASLIESYPDESDLVRQILICEQEGDRLTHAIIRLVGEGARPPLQRIAAHELATRIDDIVDHVEQAADCFGLYAIEAPMDPSPALADVLVSSAREIEKAVCSMRERASMDQALMAVHRLENEGDRLSREAIASLFAGGVDPMVVIRWKDIFEQIERAIDSCEDVAHTLESGTV